MERRVWIKQIALVGGAILVLPACRYDGQATSVILKNISINHNDERLLSEIAETIIPRTTTRGAKDLNLHQFVLKMFDDCYNQKQQECIVFGLKQFDTYTNAYAGAFFATLENDKKLAVLRTIAKSASANADLNYFLTETRNWTIKGYSTSEYVLTEIGHYEMVPGRFHGCVKN